jgi:hypothetical protein
MLRVCGVFRISELFLPVTMTIRHDFRHFHDFAIPFVNNQMPDAA